MPAAPMSTPSDHADDQPAATAARACRSRAAGTTSSSMNAFSDSLALRQMRTMTPMARKVGQPRIPTNPMCREVVMNCTAMSSGMRMAAIDADAAAVVDGPGVDVGGLPLHRDQQPRHGVDEHHDATDDGQSRTKPMRTHVTSIPVSARRRRRRRPGRGCRGSGAGAQPAADVVVTVPCWRMLGPVAGVGDARPVARPGPLSHGGRRRTCRPRAAPVRTRPGLRALADGRLVGRPPSVSGRVPGSGASAIPR